MRLATGAPIVVRAGLREYQVEIDDELACGAECDCHKGRIRLSHCATMDTLVTAVNEISRLELPSLGRIPLVGDVA